MVKERVLKAQQDKGEIRFTKYDLPHIFLQQSSQEAKEEC
mgnify:CR=1 FL=1